MNRYVETQTEQTMKQMQFHCIISETRTVSAVENGQFDGLCVNPTMADVTLSGCLVPALQLHGVWQEVATGARASGSQSFLLVSTSLTTFIQVMAELNNHLIFFPFK